MRWLAVALLVLIALLQHPLWLGKGGWLRVREVDRQLQEQKGTNKRLETRNAGLVAEVIDLKQGFEAIEERARFELGMVKQDEVFVQIPDKPVIDKQAAAATPARAGPAEKARVEKPRAGSASATHGRP